MKKIIILTILLLAGCKPSIQRMMSTAVHIKSSEGWEGSGVIVSSDGLILTAGHVIGGKLTVILDDNRKFTTVKSEILDNDVGWLKIEAINLPYAVIGDFNKVQVGEFLYVVGSQFGIDNFNSVTLGILSAKLRTCELWDRCFQTDAAANPGSSGGPVFDSDGRLIGIIVGGPGTVYIGIVYCVPIEKKTIEKIKNILDKGGN